MNQNVPQEVFLTPEQAEQRRLELKRFGNAYTIPRLRLIGFTLLAVVGIPLHNLIITHNFRFQPFAIFLGLVLLYCAVSWLLIRRFYGRARALNVGDLFLYLDLVVVAGAVYVTGGQNSWFFWLPLMRVFDQAIHGFRRALSFVVASTAIFIGLWLYLWQVEQRAIDLDSEIAKTLFVAVAGFYIALTSNAVQQVRRKLTTTMAFARDAIAQLRDKSEALMEARMRAEQASQSKSEFLARVSQELRRPATTVIGFAQLLEMGDLSAKQTDYAARILRSGQELGIMLDEVMDLADIESGVLRITPQELSVAQMTEEALSVLWPLAASRAVRLSVDPPDEDLYVWADQRALRRALLNILVHVVRNGGEEEKVSVRWERNGEWARIAVRGGAGAASAEIDEGFNSSGSAQDEIARSRALALGLAFAKALVVAMNGRVGAALEFGHAATYWLDVPLAPASTHRYTATPVAHGS